MAELQAAMSSREFAEWIALFRLRPYGEWSEDYRSARLAAIIVNVMTRSKKSDPIAKAEDFMPDFGKILADAFLDEADEEEMPPEAVVSVADKVKAFFGPLAAASKKKAESERQTDGTNASNHR